MLFGLRFGLLLVRDDLCKHRAHWKFLPRLSDKPLDCAFKKNLDVDGSFVGLDSRNDIAAFDAIARFDFPFDKSPGAHIGAEARHLKLRHAATCA
jgi:hypothetical protein